MGPVVDTRAQEGRLPPSPPPCFGLLLQTTLPTSVHRSLRTEVGGLCVLIGVRWGVALLQGGRSAGVWLNNDR